MFSRIQPFSIQKCHLGESPVWSTRRNSFFWLDIINKTLFEKRFDSCAVYYDNKWVLKNSPSVAVLDTIHSNVIWFASEAGIHRLNLLENTDQLVVKTPIATTHRTNDGSIGADGSFYFGSMQWKPSGRNGDLFKLTPNGILEKFSVKIGIPNTFVWVDSRHIAISDSYQKTIDLYRADLKTLHHVETIYDFSKEQGEPDGGALDIDGTIWLALWGASKIIRLDPLKKKKVGEINLPFVRPSSCCFGGENQEYLFITSASLNEVSQDNLDGMSFLVEMDTSGREKKGFSLCKDKLVSL